MLNHIQLPPQKWVRTDAGGHNSPPRTASLDGCPLYFGLLDKEQTDAPRPGGHFTRAGLSYDSVYGTVESSWARRNGKTVYTVTVPANCTAQISLPGGMTKAVGAGTYTFEEESA